MNGPNDSRQKQTLRKGILVKSRSFFGARAPQRVIFLEKGGYKSPSKPPEFLYRFNSRQWGESQWALASEASVYSDREAWSGPNRLRSRDGLIRDYPLFLPCQYIPFSPAHHHTPRNWHSSVLRIVSLSRCLFCCKALRDIFKIDACVFCTRMTTNCKNGACIKMVCIEKDYTTKKEAKNTGKKKPEALVVKVLAIVVVGQGCSVRFERGLGRGCGWEGCTRRLTSWRDRSF